MPVRKIPKNHISVTGRHATHKSIGQADFESPLERDYLILLDFDPQVKSYEVQPVVVPVQGVSKGYVPDVLVHFHPDAAGVSRESELTEIKTSEDYERHREKYAPKFAAAAKFASERDWIFVQKSDKEIRTPRLANLKFLRAYRRVEPSPSDIEVILGELHKQGGVSTLSRVMAALCPDDEARAHLLPTLWHLVAMGSVHVDLDKPLDADVQVLLAGGRP